MKTKTTKFNVLCLIKPLGLFFGNPFQSKSVKGVISSSHEARDSREVIDEKYMNETKELLKKLIEENTIETNI